MRTLANVQYVNDSKGTNVGATLAALHGLQNGKNIILLAGGEGKGADFTPLQNAMAQHCKKVIGFGRDGAQIAQLAEDYEVVDTLEQALASAHKFSTDGDVVLLSPACASFDQFKSFEHRGECFVTLVEALV